MQIRLEESILLNAAFLLPPSIAASAREMSKKAQRDYPAFFTLDMEFRIPHITVYMGACLINHRDAFIETVEATSKKFWPMLAKYQGMYSEYGYIQANFFCTPQLLLFQQAMANALKPFAQQFTAEPYRPHITFTRIANQTLANAIAFGLSWEVQEFPLETIAVLASGEHGTCSQPRALALLSPLEQNSDIEL